MDEAAFPYTFGVRVTDAGNLSAEATVTVELLPSLSINDVSVNEADGQATFTVTLSFPSFVAVTVDYATFDDTATEPDDYTATTGTLIFAPGETSKTIVVPIISDEVLEEVERFYVELSNEVEAWIKDGQGEGIINDPARYTFFVSLTIDGQSTPDGSSSTGFGLTRADYEQFESERSAWLQGMGSPSVPPNADSYADLDAYYQTALTRLNVAQSRIQELVAAANDPGTTRAQYLEKLKDATFEYDRYLKAYQEVLKVQAQFLSSQWVLSSADQGLLSQIDALPVRLDDLDVRLRPEQWDGLEASTREVGRILRDMEADLSFAYGALKGGLKMTVMAGAGVAVAIAWPAAVPFMMKGGAVFLAGGIGISLKTRRLESQGPIEATVGAVSDVSGFTHFYIGWYREDPITGQRVEISAEEAGQLWAEGATTLGATLVGATATGSTTRVELPIPHPTTWGRAGNFAGFATVEGVVVDAAQIARPIAIPVPAVNVHTVVTTLGASQVVLVVTAPDAGGHDGYGRYPKEDYDDDYRNLSIQEIRKRELAYEAGVQLGRQKAREMGLMEPDDPPWANPLGDAWNTPGFDDIMVDADGNYWIIEYKGGHGEICMATR
ncbi:MAG: hypothetical protein GXP27_04335 [Planctomycetes bacterium]|nr:hypothetical protein [Planctomycetota bacterium]